MSKIGFLAGLLSIALAGVATAGPITTVVVYGDSLSDNGNFFKATGSPPPPYFMGRFSNGPVAVEDLAKLLGTPLLDFAWGGATTGIGNHLDPGGTATSFGVNHLPGMTTLYASSLPAVTPIAAGALFVILGGANDLLSPSPLDTTPIAVANRAVADELAIVNGLRSIGAQRILVEGLPDLGLTPFLRLQGPVAAAQASAFSDYFDAQLKAQLPSGVTYFDTTSVLRALVANPAAFGFTNVTDQCFNATAGTLCSNPDQYLFFDDIHPTARANTILAADLAAAVPEPSTLILFASSFAALAFWRSGRSKLPRSE